MKYAARNTIMAPGNSLRPIPIINQSIFGGPHKPIEIEEYNNDTFFHPISYQSDTISSTEDNTSDENTRHQKRLKSENCQQHNDSSTTSTGFVQSTTTVITNRVKDMQNNL